jgi:hypothetical protein
MNLIETLSLSILCVALAVAGEAASKVPPATQAAIDKSIDSNLVAANKAYSAFQVELMKAQDKIVKDLEKLKADALKKADLASANAIDAEIQSVKEKGKLGERVASGDKADLLGDAKVDLAKAIVGKWKYALKASAGVLIIDAKGNVTHPQGFIGKIQTIDDKTEIIWSNNTKWDVAMKDSAIYISDNASESKLVK